MLRPDDARRLVAYNRAVFERYLRAVERLSPRSARVDRGIGHLSFQNTLAHVLRVHEGWLVYIAWDRVDELLEKPFRYGHYPSMPEVHRYSDRVWPEIEAVTHRLSPRDLRRRVRAPWMPGEYRLEDAYLQTSFEQAHHLGEIIGAFWRMNREPPEMTWIDTNRDALRRRRVPRSRRGASRRR